MADVAKPPGMAGHGAWAVWVRESVHIGLCSGQSALPWTGSYQPFLCVRHRPGTGSAVMNREPTSRVKRGRMSLQCSAVGPWQGQDHGQRGPDSCPASGPPPAADLKLQNILTDSLQDLSSCVFGALNGKSSKAMGQLKSRTRPGGCPGAR